MDCGLIFNSGNYGDLSICGSTRTYIGGLCSRGMNPNIYNSFSVGDINIKDCNNFYCGSLIADANDSDFYASIHDSYAVSNITVNSGFDLNYSTKSFYGGYIQISSTVYLVLKYNGGNCSQMLKEGDSPSIRRIDFATSETIIKNELYSAFNNSDNEDYIDWQLYNGYPQHKTHYTHTIIKI